MGLKNLKITFHIDAGGTVFDPFCPIHLDALVDYSLSPMVRKRKNPPDRDEEPEEIGLPLGKNQLGQYWVWAASALIPPDEEYFETIRYFRKKFRANRVSMTSGIPNLQSGPFREYNLPYTVQVFDRLEAYCVAERHRVLDLLRRNVRYIGQKRHRGMGRVNEITAEEIPEDRSMIWKGKATRWLPDKNGLRLVRLRPPYWNNCERIRCCEVGDEF